MHYPKISIVIPTYNRPLELGKCLKELSKQVNENIEIIVTNDGDPIPMLEKKFDNVLFLEGPKSGPAANRNNGAKKASGEWLLFIDDDCIPSNVIIKSYLDAIKSKKNITVFEGATLPIGAQKYYNQRCPINLQGNNLPSCNFAIKKSLFQQIDGFDERFPFAAIEDTDFYYRLKLKNIKTLFLKGACVYHPWQPNTITNYTKEYKSWKIWIEKHQHNSFTWRTYVYMLYATKKRIFLGFLRLLKLRFRGTKYYLTESKFHVFRLFYLAKKITTSL